MDNPDIVEVGGVRPPRAQSCSNALGTAAHRADAVDA